MFENVRLKHQFVAEHSKEIFPHGVGWSFDLSDALCLAWINEAETLNKNAKQYLSEKIREVVLDEYQNLYLKGIRK